MASVRHRALRPAQAVATGAIRRADADDLRVHGHLLGLWLLARLLKAHGHARAHRPAPAVRLPARSSS